MTEWVEYGAEDRYREVRRVAGGLHGKTVELGANRSNRILKSSITVDIKPNADIKADLNKPLPFKANSIEVILACEIIEHLSNPYRFLKEVRRVLKPKGYLILTTPNIACLKNRIMLFLGRFPMNAAMADFYRFWINDPDIPQVAHFSDYTFGMIEHALKKEKFEILEKTTNGFYLKGKKMLPKSLTKPEWGEAIIIKSKKL